MYGGPFIWGVYQKEPIMVNFRSILWFIILILSIGSFLPTGCYKGGVPYVRYVPTPDEVVIEMLQMARVTQNDIVYDLGCGDGRIVIAAAKVFGARGVGVDIDPLRVQESKRNAQEAGVTDRVNFIQQDLFQTDIREATVVTLYLFADLNLKLRPKLFRELRPGTRVLSHEFDMGDWKPDNRGTIRKLKISHEGTDMHSYYYWVIPADVAGVWRWSMTTSEGDREYSLRLIQTFQKIRGEMNVKGHEGPIAEAQLAGDQLSFTFREDTNNQKAMMRFNGRISGDTIRGNVAVQGGPYEGIYEWMATRGL
jgi:SAM-dependent methyltransferase